MKRFCKDRIAITTALVGVILMAFTILWRINPVEGSVVPGFLTGNHVGKAVIWILFVTCMPVWIAAVSLSTSFPLPGVWQWPVSCALMLVIQGAIYFMVGKLISVVVGKIRQRKE